MSTNPLPSANIVVSVSRGKKRAYKPRLSRKPYIRTFKKKSTRRAKNKPSVAKLKKELEALQKQIVIKLYGTDCYTCPAKNLEGTNRQLGHVPWPRSIISTQAKFDHRLTRIQCFNCNIRRGGMGAVAYERMLKEGVDLVSLRNWSDSLKGKVVPRAWFEEEIKKYQEKLGVE